MATPSFRELEHAGWNRKAGQYDDFFATITGQAIEPILDTLDVTEGCRLLDVACGTGALSAAARRRGSIVTGIDFAAEMIGQASRKHPGIVFEEGDAMALSFDDASFDVVVCSFGILHLEEPELAVAEALRVLRPGGRYGLTVWLPSGDYFELAMTAIKTFGRPDVPLPPAPPPFRFADQAECHGVLAKCGFADVSFSELSLVWRCRSPEDVLALSYQSIRLSMVLEAQAVADRERIRQAILEGAERYRKGMDLEFRFPVLLVSALKPKKER